jgi:hypothetical protein
MTCTTDVEYSMHDGCITRTIAPVNRQSWIDTYIDI